MWNQLHALSLVHVRNQVHARCQVCEPREPGACVESAAQPCPSFGRESGEKKSHFFQDGNVLTVSVDLRGKQPLHFMGSELGLSQVLEHNVQDQVSASQVAAWGYLSGCWEARVMNDRSVLNGLQCTESHCHQGMEALGEGNSPLREA